MAKRGRPRKSVSYEDIKDDIEKETDEFQVAAAIQAYEVAKRETFVQIDEMRKDENEILEDFYRKCYER